jgi:hypothetical protein
MRRWPGGCRLTLSRLRCRCGTRTACQRRRVATGEKRYSLLRKDLLVPSPRYQPASLICYHAQTLAENLLNAEEGNHSVMLGKAPRMSQTGQLAVAQPVTTSIWTQRSKALLVVSVLILSTVSCRQNARPGLPQLPATIFIIRHAEKLTGGQMDLSAAGEERARLLAQVFNGSTPDIPAPQVLFAAHASAHSNRSLQTLVPLATSLHLPIDDSFKNQEFESLAASLLSGKYAGKVVLVAWHRGKIPKIAAAVGAKPPYSPWPEQEYDRIWRIDYCRRKSDIAGSPLIRGRDNTPGNEKRIPHL